jgi:osmotically-inducible protein OsmY
MKPFISLLALALVCACSKNNDSYASEKSSHPTTSNAPASSTPSTPAKTMPAHPNATDTSNTKADVDLQALVRKSIVGDDSLSTSAKNVVIVVKGGDVTLRGTVPTADEKTRIGTLATNVAGVTNVDNQIEVKP